LLNGIIAVSPHFGIVKWLWLINGFSLSVLWPSLIRLCSESLAKRDLTRSSIAIGTTVASGTLVIYGLSALYAVFNVFKLSFYTAAAADFAVAMVWLFTYDKAVSGARQLKAQEYTEAIQSNAKAQTVEEIGNLRMIRTLVAFLCVFAVGINLIKDGLNTWVPSVLKEAYGLPASISILLTLCLPMIAICGNAFALRVHKRIPDYVSQCAGTFAITGCIVMGILWSLNSRQVAVMLGGLALSSLLVSSLNSLVTSIFPMFMRNFVNSGMMAGVINGFCYLGSTISSYGLGFIADRKGWSAVFWTLLAFCVLACVLWGVYMIIRRTSSRLQKNGLVTQ